MENATIIIIIILVITIGLIWYNHRTPYMETMVDNSMGYPTENSFGSPTEMSYYKKQNMMRYNTPARPINKTPAYKTPAYKFPNQGQSLKRHKFYLFYSQNCGACKNFKPIWDEFKSTNDNSKFSGSNPFVDAVAIDVDDDKNLPLVKKYGINSVPTMYFDNKKYQGAHNLQSIKNFVNNSTPEITRQ